MTCKLLNSLFRRNPGYLAERKKWYVSAMLNSHTIKKYQTNPTKDNLNKKNNYHTLIPLNARERTVRYI